MRFYSAAYFRVVLSSADYTFVTAVWMGGRRKSYFGRYSKPRHSASELSSLNTPRKYIQLSADIVHVGNRCEAVKGEES